MRWLILLSIRAYQRHVSPHKGFHCAYRVVTGRASCSALGYRTVRRHGVRAGLALLAERTRRCGEAQRSRIATVRDPHHRLQRGVCDCDLPCLACDVPCSGGRLPDASCLDVCSCDWPSRRKGNDEAGRRAAWRARREARQDRGGGTPASPSASASWAR